MFEECGTIDRAEVVYGRDGRSRVSFLNSMGPQAFTFSKLACIAISKHCTYVHSHCTTIAMGQLLNITYVALHDMRRQLL